MLYHNLKEKKKIAADSLEISESGIFAHFEEKKCKLTSFFLCQITI